MYQLHSLNNPTGVLWYPLGLYDLWTFSLFPDTFLWTNCVSKEGLCISCGVCTFCMFSLFLNRGVLINI